MNTFRAWFESHSNAVSHVSTFLQSIFMLAWSRIFTKHERFFFFTFFHSTDVPTYLRNNIYTHNFVFLLYHTRIHSPIGIEICVVTILNEIKSNIIECDAIILFIILLMIETIERKSAYSPIADNSRLTAQITFDHKSRANRHSHVLLDAGALTQYSKSETWIMCDVERYLTSFLIIKIMTENEAVPHILN